VQTPAGKTYFTVRLQGKHSLKVDLKHKLDTG